MPRLSFGYDTFAAKQMNLRYVMETQPALAKELATLAAPVPGLTGSGTGMLDLGYGLDLNALVRFVGARASAVAAAPFQCESLQPLNQRFAEMNQQLANPAVFMAGAALKGLNVSLSKLELGEGAPPVVEGKLAIASDNPQSLLQMAGSFMPQLASLQLTAGAAPVAMPAELQPPGMPPAHLALGPQALAVSLGAGQDSGLTEFASAAPGKPAPMLYYGVDGRGMSMFMQSATRTIEAQLAAIDAQAAAGASPDSETPPMDAKEIEQLRSSLEMLKGIETSYAKILDRVDFTVYGTERGIEARYAIRMK
jgi:hypothetical protein